MSKQPILFIGHGSPMNAIEDNIYTQTWKNLGNTLTKPRAILMLSAHWITEGETHISSAEQPAMIYDMYGFPPELYQVVYDAPGSVEIAEEIVSVIASEAIAESRHLDHRDAPLLSSSEGGSVSGEMEQDFYSQGVYGLSTSKITETDASRSKGQKQPKIIPDPTRGYDHGVWSTLIHLFPLADVPVVTMSLDYLASPSELFSIGQSLAILRDRGILIIGSGNIVHNLGAIDWSGTHTYAWAREFDKKVAHLIESRDYSQLLEFKNWGEVSRLAHPSYDHLLPLFPLLGASIPEDHVEFFTPDIVMGSLSMRSVVWKVTQ